MGLRAARLASLEVGGVLRITSSWEEMAHMKASQTCESDSLAAAGTLTKVACLDHPAFATAVAPAIIVFVTLVTLALVGLLAPSATASSA